MTANSQTAVSFTEGKEGESSTERNSLMIRIICVPCAQCRDHIKTGNNTIHSMGSSAHREGFFDSSCDKMLCEVKLLQKERPKEGVSF